MPRKLINLRLSDEELVDLDQAAQAESMDRSTYLRKRAKVTPEWFARVAGIPVATARERLNER